MKAPYQYDGIEAASYDLIDELSDFDDYDFYRLLIESNPGPVLDLGCGTGRILVPLAKEGIEVVGLDTSKKMLEICQEKLDSDSLDVRLIHGDIRNFVLDERFSTILIPGFSVQLLLEEEDLESCLKTCLEHLNPGGQLVMPTYLPWEMLESGFDRVPLQERRESAPDENEKRFVAWQGWVIYRLDQRLTLENRFQHVEADGSVVEDENRSMTIWWHLPYEMQNRLTSLGYLDVAIYGDFLMDAPMPNSESIIYVCKA